MTLKIAIELSKHGIAFRIDTYGDCIYVDNKKDIWYCRSGEIQFIDDGRFDDFNDWQPIEGELT